MPSPCPASSRPKGLNIDGTNPVTARRLAVAAWAVFPTGQAASAITTLLAEQQQQGMLPADPSTVSAVAFNPGARLLASAGADGMVRLWNPATGRPVGKPLHASAQTTARYGVRAVAFSPDGKLLASAGADGTVRLWDPATGRQVGKTLHASARYGVYGVAFRSDGKLLAKRRQGRHRAAMASIAIHAYLCGALLLRGTTDTTRMEPLRLWRNAAEGLRLNADRRRASRSQQRPDRRHTGPSRAGRYGAVAASAPVRWPDTSPRSARPGAAASVSITASRWLTAQPGGAGAAP